MFEQNKCNFFQSKNDNNQLKYDYEVLRHINIPGSVRQPAIIIIVGPCRTGTTALANAFASVGKCYLQPIKYFRKKISKNEKIVDNLIIESNEKFITTKETLGIYSDADFFNPIDVYIKKGFLPENVRLIALARDPFSTLTSCKRMWAKVDIQQFIRSFKELEKIMEYAQNLKILTLPVVYEMLRDNDPKDIILALVKLLNVRSLVYSEKMINWEEDISSNNNMKFFGTPPSRFLNDFKKGTQYFYKKQKANLLSDEEKIIINDSGIYHFYAKLLKQSNKLLLKTKEYNK